MEALSFLKFWRPNSPISSPKLHFNEEDDSFFELNLNDATPKNRAFPIPLFSPRNLFSGGKIQPYDAHRRRHSLFKPSPEFRSFWSRTFSSSETEQVEELKTEHRRRTNFSGAAKNSVSAPKRFSGGKIQPYDAHRRRQSLFKPSPEFRSFWSRTFSSSETEQVEELKTERRRRTNFSGAAKNSGSAAKRFSGEEVRSARVKASALSSPVAAAWKLAGKGKSFSGAAAKGGLVSPARGDESVSVQQEGIQSAILHCKKSLHSV